MYKDYGSTFGMSIMGNDELIVSDPHIFDTILRNEGKYPIGGAESVTTFQEYYTENNMTFALQSMSRGDDWKEWRTAVNPDIYSFWQGYLPLIAETARTISTVAGHEVAVVSSGHKKNNVQFVDFITRSAFDMFASAMYGESPQTTDSTKATPEDMEFVSSAQQSFDLTGELMLNPFEKVFASDKYKSFEENMDRVYGLGKQKSSVYLEEAIKTQTKKGAGQAGDGVSECPVSGVLSKFKAPSMIEKMVHRGKMEIGEVAEMGPLFVMAGVDTTAYVLSWLFLNLASNLEVQAKLATELKDVLKGEDLTTVEQMDSLPYLKACIRESHRLTPPSPIVAKSLEKDIDLQIGDIAYTVKAEERVSLNLRGYPMDPKYVDAPNEYRPERFLQDAIDARKGTPSEILDHPNFADPFGRGKRRCLGANIAMAEILILTARLVQDYEISLDDPTVEWKPRQKLMLKAHPYPAMHVVPRTYITTS